MDRRRGKVFVEKKFAGIIKQSEGIYSFTYTEEYLKSVNPKPVSLTLPLRKNLMSKKL